MKRKNQVQRLETQVENLMKQQRWIRAGLEVTTYQSAASLMKLFNLLDDEDQKLFMYMVSQKLYGNAALLSATSAFLPGQFIRGVPE